MSKFVMIQSEITIRVTNGLEYEDNTNYVDYVKDSVKITPVWNKTSVVIQKGRHAYPAEVADWKTVKDLERDNVLTIGKVVDETDERVDDKSKADQKRIDEGKTFVANRKKQKADNQKKIEEAKAKQIAELNLEKIANKEGE